MPNSRISHPLASRTRICIGRQSNTISRHRSFPFQAQKFPGAENATYREKIRRAQSPKDAKVLGRTRKIAIRPDWEDVKESIMLAALRKKFAAEDLRQLLLDTRDRELVEASPSDSYWGCGRSGKGKNRLGQLLMQVRAELRTGV
jgi:ribA/ribD-fused uncharacterized protein